MEKVHVRGLCIVAPGIVLAYMLLAACPSAFALNPSLDVSQYAHTSWRTRDGFPKGEIRAIAQTPDGYLWLGTEFGLVRFDGVRNVPWQPPTDQPLPSNDIFGLLAAGDGTLWIGTSKGLASWKDGKLTQYPELAGQYIFRLLEDREGSVWAGAGFGPNGRLCAIHNGSIQCYGEDGSLGRVVLGLYEDSKGNLWVGVKDGLWRWKPGPPKFYPLPGAPNGISALAEDGGTLLVGVGGGIRRFVDGKTDAYPLPSTVGKIDPVEPLRDRDGGLWIGSNAGLVHLHQGRADVFTEADTLSGNSVIALFEDREGNVWVATFNGLDRFRDFAVATFSVKQGLSNALVGSALAARDGSVWLGTEGGLNQWNKGQISISHTGSDKPDGKLNGLAPNSLFQDDHGRIWASTVREFGYLENGRFISISGVPGGYVPAIAEDTAGNLWMSYIEIGLVQLPHGGEVQQIPWARLGRNDVATALAADPVQGGLWLGFFRGGVAYFKDGQVRASYAAADGLGEGRVNYLGVDPDGTLWAATAKGFSRLKNGRIATLTATNGLPCDAIHWVIEDDAHSFWLYTACGLLRVARSELDAWAADSDRKIQATVFDSSDGVRSFAEARGYSPKVAKSSDGKLWFLPLDGVSVVDPRHLPFNRLPPPVHIEQITADRKTYDATPDGSLRLPPLIRDLQIDYTALSLVAPEKILFRYMLEGRDSDWQEAGNRRQAFYTDLPPANYRFRVMACNNSGVWNEAGTFLDFTIDPAYYQTTWFRLSCLAAFLLLLGALYQLRVRQMARQFNMRIEERVNERTRIARDLHDTLLQRFQGVLLKFHAVTYMLPNRPAQARQKLESVIDQAEQAITEGRDTVQGLRSSTVVTNDLSPSLSTLAEELAADQIGQNRPDFRVIVEGTPRNLVPLVRDEAYRIAGEALRNAFQHAQAELIEVEILYDKRQLRVRVRDNGKGIDPKVLAEGGREGHYGLAGMHERARLVGGKLAVLSKCDTGTEAELTIPGSLAYAKSPVSRWSIFSRGDSDDDRASRSVSDE